MILNITFFACAMNSEIKKENMLKIFPVEYAKRFHRIKWIIWKFSHRQTDRQTDEQTFFISGMN